LPLLFKLFYSINKGTNNTYLQNPLLLLKAALKSSVAVAATGTAKAWKIVYKKIRLRRL
jgi:hypothetical protein